MILKDWLKKENMKGSDFAKKIGVCTATVSRIMSPKNHQRLSAKHAVSIEKITNGQVSRTEAIWPEQNPEQKNIDKNVPYPLLEALRKNTVAQDERFSTDHRLISALKRWTDIEVERKIQEIQIKEKKHQQQQIEKDFGIYLG